MKATTPEDTSAVMDHTIQCTDDRTGKLGCFGFRSGRHLNTGKVLYYSLTPVFSSLPELFTYCKENAITLSHNILLKETGTNKPFKA